MDMDTRQCVVKTPTVLALHRMAAPHCCTARRYRRPMDAFAIDRSGGREDGEDWTENFTVGSEQFRGHAGQVLVVPADTPHKFSTGPDGYEGVHIHAGVKFVTEWLE
jgi:hypothetical protein